MSVEHERRLLIQELQDSGEYIHPKGAWLHEFFKGTYKGTLWKDAEDILPELKKSLKHFENAFYHLQEIETNKELPITNSFFKAGDENEYILRNKIKNSIEAFKRAINVLEYVKDKKVTVADLTDAQKTVLNALDIASLASHHNYLTWIHFLEKYV